VIFVYNLLKGNKMITREFDTIAAISTPLGEGAIGIVRLSGTDSFAIAQKIFKGKDLSKVASHTLNYGHIVDPSTGKVMDEVMVGAMKSPKTFTREDIIEINTHGGIAVTNEILQLAIREGARLAEPGEFTKRAFLNGRVDLTQAEAVMDIIRAKTDKAMNIAVKQLDGSLSELINNTRQEILNTLAQVEVNIDYPEYDDVEEATTAVVREKTMEFEQLLTNLLKTARRGKILREGISTAIIGRPNVGKSSLLNNLLREDKAIVSNIHGTTRDIIEDTTEINKITFRFIDTAGIRKTEDYVEQLGIEKAFKKIDEASIVLWTIDQIPTADDINEMKRLTEDKKLLIVFNKMDCLSQQQADNHLPFRVIYISAKYKEHINELEAAIYESADIPTIRENSVIVTNARHYEALARAKESIQRVIDGIQLGLSGDLISEDLRLCLEQLGEITGGQITTNEVLGNIFKHFCIGK